MVGEGRHVLHEEEAGPVVVGKGEEGGHPRVLQLAGRAVLELVQPAETLMMKINILRKKVTGTASQT